MSVTVGLLILLRCHMKKKINFRVISPMMELMVLVILGAGIVLGCFYVYDTEIKPNINYTGDK